MAKKSVHQWNELSFVPLVLQASGTVLVDFTAGGARVQTIVPHHRTNCRRDSGRVSGGSVDVDACPDLASEFRIRGVPTLVFFRTEKRSPRRRD